MAIMMAGNRATARDAAQGTDHANQQSTRGRAGSPGAMTLQTSRGYEAVPQAFVRLTGSYLAKPRVSRAVATD
jgi:hypothetical protein